MSEQNNDNKIDNVNPVGIQQEMKDCYLDYAMSVIVGRALPDVRDGMKPVHRRVLYAMNDLSNFHNRPFLKSARVVGDVIGKYHPHGDSAVYGTVVRMAQDFSLRYPLIDGQGNFGSIDGDNAAAMRYTEIRMMKVAEEMLQDLEKETVEWQPNYDGAFEEPKVLPTKIPNLLINGSSGIAVGMATNIPPHNLSEVTKGLIALLDNRDIGIDELVKIIPGPDFPTAGAIHGIEGIKSAYHTGRGVIQIRAKADIEVTGKSDREKIVITEIPYQVNKAKLIERIAELVNAKELVGISDIRDESNREGIRIVIDLKKGEAGNVILNRLYKTTQLQTSFGIIFLAIINGGPKIMNLKEMLVAFLEHRREVVIRRTIFDLKKTKQRAHILEGLKIAVENIDKLVDTIKKAEGPSQAKADLIKDYSLSEIQAQAILDLRLQRLTGLERDKIINEYKDTMKEIERLEGILADDSKVKEIIRNEFLEIIENYGDARKTEIIGRTDEILTEDLIKREEQILTVTHRGYIKRMPMDTFTTQNRGGTGKTGGDSMDDDFYIEILTANTHSTILFFTTKGTVFAQKVYNIPEGSRTSMGRNIANIIQIPSGEKIKAIKVVDENELDSKNLIFATEQGIIKRTSLGEYRHIKSSGIKAINIVDGDNLMAVSLTDGKKEVLLCSSSGKVVRFPEEDVRLVGRVSQGVRGLTIDEGEKVVSMEIIDDSVEVLTITEKGFGKRSSVSEYRRTSRGGKGVLAMRLSDKSGGIVGIRQVTDKDDLMIITDGGQVIRIRIAQISLLGRVSLGVRLIRVKDGEKIVAVEKIAQTEGEQNVHSAVPKEGDQE